MDKQIIHLDSLDISTDDILIFQKKTDGKTLNVKLDDLIRIIKTQCVSISEYNLNDVDRNFVQECFSVQNLNKMLTAPSYCNDILEYCKIKSTIETEIILGTVRRTILFNYDSYIFYNEKYPPQSDYYNYIGSVVLNDVIYNIRIQFWLDGHWTCTVSNKN